MNNPVQNCLQDCIYIFDILGSFLGTHHHYLGSEGGKYKGGESRLSKMRKASVSTDAAGAWGGGTNR